MDGIRMRTKDRALKWMNWLSARLVVLVGPAAGRSGQGTVEYVGLILLVSLLMVGMVAAMKGFSGAQGTELAELIVDKIQSAVDKISFR